MRGPHSYHRSDTDISGCILINDKKALAVMQKAQQKGKRKPKSTRAAAPPLPSVQGDGWHGLFCPVSPSRPGSVSSSVSSESSTRSSVADDGLDEPLKGLDLMTAAENRLDIMTSYHLLLSV